MHGVEWNDAADAAEVSPGVLVRDGDVVDVGGGGGEFENLAVWYPNDEVPGQLGECVSRAGARGFWIGQGARKPSP